MILKTWILFSELSFINQSVQLMRLLRQCRSAHNLLIRHKFSYNPSTNSRIDTELRNWTHDTIVDNQSMKCAVALHKYNTVVVLRKQMNLLEHQSPRKPTVPARIKRSPNLRAVSRLLHQTLQAVSPAQLPLPRGLGGSIRFV